MGDGDVVAASDVTTELNMVTVTKKTVASPVNP